ncbi:glycerol-3-phosphate dehydrogenase subunit B [Halobellus salinus]|uniref:Glycerol-3-phosphate dehydrogenase subunit B n=1 Tax=Halobellus salinus TaxID=931585 RepID=A0A830EME9_9EURY|nr:glycerol-3-phosphate dehydrogenase subunit GlpB [Halobellus salinus]GGJ03101.1 glycerol-3-phosphate dehydrogenase subunit B [Halobellus salinus]SMP21703.1 glycerol 3-phosphate dehydrogenase (quinone) subunit B [Halobellus salinus]
MPIRDDVVVVGGGLAGSMAALSAAESGAQVRLISHKKSTLRQASGLVDVLGAVNGDAPVSDPFAAVDQLPDKHPYRVVGVGGIREGLRRFDDVVGDRYRGAHTDRNALVVTHGGTVKPTARYPVSVAPGLASAEEDTLLVGFRGLTDFDAGAAADHLEAAGVPFDVDGSTVDFPIQFRDDARTTRFARALDKDQKDVRARLADAVVAELDAHDRVGFPAMLGDDHEPEVREFLEGRLSATVFQIPTGPPSLLGMQLEDLLIDALERAEVRLSTGNPAVGYETDEGELTAVTVDRRGRDVPYYADEFVLATGGLVGKGIDSDRESVVEPLFGCHVPHPADRYEWSEAEAFGDHAFARFGVVPDDDLRPTDADGDVHFRNLRAAGGVLGGADVAREKSAAGVSISTGTYAGRRAGEETVR